MAETMRELQDRAFLWPGAYGEQAKVLIRDYHYDTFFCQKRDRPLVWRWLWDALISLEEAMLAGEEV